MSQVLEETDNLSQAEHGPLARFGLCTLWALPLLVAHLYLKYTLLEYGGLDIAQRALSLTEVSPITYLGFYARDVLETLLFVPLALFVLVSAMPRPGRQPLLFLTAFLGLLLAAICWGSYVTLGRYPGTELVVDFIRAYQVDRSTVDPLSVFPPRQLAKIAALLLLALGPLVATRLPFLGRFASRNLRKLVGLQAGAVLAAFALVMASGATSYHRGHLSRAAGAAVAQDAFRLQDGTQFSRDELHERYQNVVFPEGLAPADASAPAPEGRPPNLIVVVLETASARDYAFTAEAMPEVAKLRPHSIHAKRHLSTYPYSVRANFSLFSSVYDLDSKDMMADALMHAEPRPMDSLALVLGKRGYTTRYYYPVVLNHKSEQWMWPYLGFQEVISGSDFDEAVESSPELRESRAGRDQALFDRVIEDMSQLNAEGTPHMFAVVVALGHAPYPDIRSEADQAAKPTPDRADLVGAIRSFLDDQIGRLIQTLEADGRLEDTILVVTGDHGVRSIPDDPRLDLRVLNEASFHVPLLIHYPRGIEQAEGVDAITSHVDIAPTIFQLAGIEMDALFLEGLPVTDPRIEDRVTFFLGGHYYGSNGLHYRGRYFMENEIAETTYVNDSFSFDGDALVTPNKPELAAEAERYRAILHEFRRSQMAVASWLRDSGE